MEVMENQLETAPAKAKKVRAKMSGKKIGLKQLEQKVFNRVAIGDERMVATIGSVSDAWDLALIGKSGAGKSNMAAKIIEGVVQAFKCKCTMVNYEEGHEATLQETLIHRHKMFEKLGNAITIWDHLTYDELVSEMSKRKSAKLWVIDSVQTSFFTAQQCNEIRKKFVLGKKKKIIIWISWAQGDYALGAVGRSVQYWAHIKLLVKKRVAIVLSNRFGGKKSYIIDDEAARKMWGVKEYNKHKKG